MIEEGIRKNRPDPSDPLDVLAKVGGLDLAALAGFYIGCAARGIPVVLDGLITNFHLPQSTLIMLVSAFAGYEHTMNAYHTAVAEKYRFFSFGDAMLIL